jgi:hypothetical protein
VCRLHKLQNWPHMPHNTVTLKSLLHVSNSDVCNFLKNIENKEYKNIVGKCKISRFLGLCGLVLRSATAQMLGWQVQILLMTWMFISCVCSVLCRWQPLRQAVHLFIGSYQVCVCLIACNVETSKWGSLGPISAVAQQKKMKKTWF